MPSLVLVTLLAPVLVGFQSATVTLCHVEAGRVVTVSESPDVASRLLERTRSYPGPCAESGPPAVLGAVVVSAYMQAASDGTPTALGIRLQDTAWASLPSEPADGYRCLDLDDDARIDVGVECVGGHERVLFLPDAWEAEVRSPFRWALFNWNPAGHGPRGVWDVPHFDFHFFIQPLADRNRIRIGRCAMLVNCEDLDVGTRPVPSTYLPEGYEDRGVVEFGMGNHLIDPSTFGSPDRPPSHSLIYGAWDGRVSFVEPMITRRFLERIRAGLEPSDCYPLPQAAATLHDGFLPR
ncbi:MAG: hypothetical protein OEN00_09920, partial [Gemmatimonadota bacterium]|nr:hypothetical protein [Gemmatimonadota bacterium]